MGFIDWLGQNWFILLQGVGIIASLLFTAVSLRKDAKARRVSNLITVTGHHRDIWTQLYRQPDLARVVDPNVDVERYPVRDEEELFINLLILHLNSVFHAIEEGLYLKPEGYERMWTGFFRSPFQRLCGRGTRDCRTKPSRDS